MHERHSIDKAVKQACWYLLPLAELSSVLADISSRISSLDLHPQQKQDLLELARLNMLGEKWCLLATITDLAILRQAPVRATPSSPIMDIVESSWVVLLRACPAVRQDYAICAA